VSIAVDWTKNLKTDDEKKKFTSLVVNNRILLGRLLEILDDKLDVIERAECNQETYQNPAYASWQAHQNGKRASLKDIHRLLEFLEA
jgi:hypothetical protein